MDEMSSLATASTPPTPADFLSDLQGEKHRGQADRKQAGGNVLIYGQPDQ